MESIRMDDWTRKAGVLRLRLIKKLLEAAGADRTEPIEVIMDRQPLPGVTANGFIIAIEEAFGGTIAAPRLFHAHFKDSKEDPGIQIADFIAHDIARKYLHGDDRWFRLFQEKIRVELNGATHL